MLLDRIVVATLLASASLIGIDSVLPEIPPAPAPAQVMVVTATPLSLNRDDPGMTQVGALRFAGAVQLTSSDARFGAISGLRDGGGDRLIAVTDTGNWLTLVTIERHGRLVGVGTVAIASLPQPDGKLAARKADVDAEAVEHDPATGVTTVVYEQQHRLAHFTGISARRPESLTQPPAAAEVITAMTGWPANGGGEAMAVLPSAARIILAEDARRPDGAIRALLTRAGDTVEIGVQPLPGYSPTDAIALDGRRILVLHCRFSGFGGWSAALTLVDLAPALTDNTAAALPQRLLARFEAPLNFDNMEGLALRRQGGKTFLYMISDDNLSRAQRTLLMKFELAETP
ncbi:MAG: esterase-like activity of phytase family protein [Polymorphobacter sp.]